MAATGLRPFLEVTQFHAQHRALQAFHAVIETFEHVVILAPLSLIAEYPHDLGMVCVIGDDHTALAIRSQVLAGIEAEAGEVTHGARAAAFIFGAVRLSCIFDYHEAVPSRDLEDGIHVGRLTIEMYWDNGAGTRCDRLFDLRRIHGERLRIDVYEYRSRAAVGNRGNACDECKWHGDDFVARPDAGSQQR
jgi:hypothetical protein